MVCSDPDRLRSHRVPRIILAFTISVGFLATTCSRAAGEGDGPLPGKQKADPARVRQLAEIVRGDPDEKRRKSAVAELGEADPRVYPEVLPAVILALRKDASATVRATAAEAIGRFGAVFSLAGLTLETSLELDPSPTVRAAAKQSLWEYHLNGYRSGKWSDGFAAQTAEPPLARPPVHALAIITGEPPIVPVAGATPSAPASLPSFAPLPGPRRSRIPVISTPRTMVSAIQPHPNLTIEPPIAKSLVEFLPTPTIPEPPIRSHWAEPVSYGTPPPFARDLPPIVSAPDPLPGVIPFPTPTAEPPIKK